jgi:hypothetical protein
MIGARMHALAVPSGAGAPTRITSRCPLQAQLVTVPWCAWWLPHRFRLIYDGHIATLWPQPHGIIVASPPAMQAAYLSDYHHQHVRAPVHGLHALCHPRARRGSRGDPGSRARMESRVASPAVAVAAHVPACMLLQLHAVATGHALGTLFRPTPGLSIGS